MEKLKPGTLIRDDVRCDRCLEYCTIPHYNGTEDAYYVGHNNEKLCQQCAKKENII